MRDFLLSRIATDAVKISAEGFKLSWGFPDPMYIDCRSALSDPDTLYAAGHCMYQEIQPEVERVAGVAIGGYPLACAASILSAVRDRPLPWLMIRKAPKKHGTGLTIEGEYLAFDRVCIVEDVVTTGQSVLGAIQMCKAAGLEVVQVLTLIDRQFGGLYEIQKLLPRAKVSSIFNKNDILAYRAHNGLTD